MIQFDKFSKVKSVHIKIVTFILHKTIANWICFFFILFRVWFIYYHLYKENLFWYYWHFFNNIYNNLYIRKVRKKNYFRWPILKSFDSNLFLRVTYFCTFTLKTLTCYVRLYRIFEIFASSYFIRSDIDV